MHRLVCLAVVLAVLPALHARAEQIAPPYAEAHDDAACDALLIGLGRCTAASAAGLDGTIVMANQITPRLGQGTPMTGRGYLLGETIARHTLAASSSVSYRVEVHVRSAEATAPQGAQATITMTANAIHRTCGTCYGLGGSNLLVSDLGPASVTGADYLFEMTLTNHQGGGVPAGTVDVIVTVEGTSLAMLASGSLRLAADLTVERVEANATL